MIDINTTYFGFTDNMKPMQKVRVETMLCNVKRYNGVIMSNEEFIYRELKSGSRPEIEEDVTNWSRKLQDYTKPKTEYRLKTQDGSYWTIEKTLHDFARYLLENDFLNDEKAEAFIIAEQNRIEEQGRIKAEQEAKEKMEKEQRERQQEEFTAWLNTEAANYNNSEKLELLKEIFFAETGQFGGGSIRLLVLIDNFDNPLCKNKLREWLSYYNTASLKTFFHLTGINLGRTDKEIQARLNSITSKDFTGSISFKPRKERTEKEQEVFYTYSFNSNDNQYEFQECRGEYFSKYGLDFFISKTNKGYNITEGKSGLSATKGNTKQEAIDSLIETINRVGIDELNNIIERSISRTGISPKYRQDVAV